MNFKTRKFIFLIFVTVQIFIFCEHESIRLEPGSVNTGQVKFTGHDGYFNTLEFTFSVPLEYDSKKDWPVVICLHENGSDVSAIIDKWKQITDSLGYVLLVPHGDDWAGNGTLRNWGEDAYQSILLSLKTLRNIVRVNGRRICLIGSNSSAEVANELCLRYRDIFCGVALLSVEVKGTLAPEVTKKVKHINFFIAYVQPTTQVGVHPSLIENILKQDGFRVMFEPSKEIITDSGQISDDKRKDIIQFLN